MKASQLVLSVGLVLAGTSACGGSDTGSGDGGKGGTGTGTDTGGGGSGTGSTTTPMAVCTEPTPITCEDAVLLDMNLQPDPTDGLISSTPDGAGWTSNIDATAGGAFAATPESYTYGKFTADGLVKVEIGDEASLSSMEWDIAFRRYVVRINSGDSGPSCVTAARVPGMPAYEDLTELPADLTYHQDDYFTDSCDFIPDGSGLESSPATALSAYWSYPGCVKMSGYVFVLELANGQHLKLIFDAYYKPDVQEQCDTTGSVPMSGSEAANFIIRWAFLD